MTLRARELLDLVLDPETFESWDTPIDLSHHSANYAGELAAAAEYAGTDESILTGCGRVRGRRVAVIANEFRFLGGSIGSAAAARIIAAVRRATAERLPLFASTASGGTRMQEGTPAFVLMVEITRAVMAHRAVGLPYLAYLRHPTTGGVFASWGSLAHVTVAEPGALIGFLGPKVYQALNDARFPEGVQTAENLTANGVIDLVVPPEDLSLLLDQALSVLLDEQHAGRFSRREATAHGVSRSAWESIQLTREADRSGVRDLLRYAATDTVHLRGTGVGRPDKAIVTALTRLDGRPCVLVGQDRRGQSAVSPLGPAALREARRAMGLAEELRLPLVTVIDTAGAELSVEAEEGAIAGEIARCIATLSTLNVPTVAVLLGQGCGGGALALLPADTVIAAENAWLSPLPPEGASAIVHGHVGHAAAMAEDQHVRAVDLFERGTVQRIVPELSGDTPALFARAVAAEIRHALSSSIRAAELRPRLSTIPTGTNLNNRLPDPAVLSRLEADRRRDIVRADGRS